MFNTELSYILIILLLMSDDIYIYIHIIYIISNKYMIIFFSISYIGPTYKYISIKLSNIVRKYSFLTSYIM